MKISTAEVTREWVDLFVPEHGRTSCNDADTQNGYVSEAANGEISLPRCTRCYLLNNLLNNMNQLDNRLEINVEVNITHSTAYKRAINATANALKELRKANMVD
jgi:hypothetical protein